MKKNPITGILHNCKNRPVLDLINWSHLNMTISRNWRSRIQDDCIFGKVMPEKKAESIQGKVTEHEFYVQCSTYKR